MIQIDMKMPNSCEDCKISRYDNDYDFAFCPFIRDGVTRYVNERHPKCPLKEPKQGEWIIRRDKRGKHIYSVCSRCNVPYLDTDFPNFCNQCGASMAKEGETK